MMLLIQTLIVGYNYVVEGEINMSNMQIETKSVFKKNDKLDKIKERDGIIEIHLLHVIYYLKEIEIDIWSKINGENTIEQIIQLMSEKYNSSYEDIQQDIIEFILELKNKDLILLAE